MTALTEEEKKESGWGIYACGDGTSTRIGLVFAET